MKRVSRLIVFLVAFVLCAGTSHAYISFSGETTGRWVNPIYDSNDYVRIYNYDQGSNAYFFFGRPYGNSYSSMLLFDGKGSDGDTDWHGIDNGSAFLIGEFSYRNGVNTSYTVDGVRGVDLNLSLNITDPLSLVMNTFSYDFSIRTTHNITGNPYLDRDFLYLIGGNSSQTFMYNSQQYTLNILGFSSDGGNSWRTNFGVSENATTYAGLYASISKSGAPPNPVPEPASMLLLGTGLLGMLKFRKKLV